MSASIEEKTGNFLGHEPRECGEHHTVGKHRAWCHECSEWCYPRTDGGCKGCEIPYLREAKDRWHRLFDQMMSYRDQALERAHKAEQKVCACYPDPRDHEDDCPMAAK